VQVAGVGREWGVDVCVSVDLQEGSEARRASESKGEECEGRMVFGRQRKGREAGMSVVSGDGVKEGLTHITHASGYAAIDPAIVPIACNTNRSVTVSRNPPRPSASRSGTHKTMIPAQRHGHHTPLRIPLHHLGQLFTHGRHQPGLLHIPNRRIGQTLHILEDFGAGGFVLRVCRSIRVRGRGRVLTNERLLAPLRSLVLGHGVVRVVRGEGGRGVVRGFPAEVTDLIE
jgi:hypothetical protein